MKTFTIKIPNDKFLIQCIRGKMKALGYVELVGWNSRVESPRFIRAYNPEMVWCHPSSLLYINNEITLPEFFNLEEPAK